jgi:dynein light intermediate chain
LAAQIKTLEQRKAELENEVLELRNKVEVIEKRENERRALEEKKRKEEVEFLKYQGQHFDQFLKSIGGSGAGIAAAK